MNKINKKWLVPIALLILVIVSAISFVGLDYFDTKKGLAFVSEFKTKSCYTYSDLMNSQNEKRELERLIAESQVNLNALSNRSQESVNTEIDTINTDISLLEINIAKLIRERTPTSSKEVSQARVKVKALKAKLATLTPAGIRKQVTEIKKNIVNYQNLLKKNVTQKTTIEGKLCPDQEVETVALVRGEFDMPQMSGACYTTDQVATYKSAGDKLNMYRAFTPMALSRNTAQINVDNTALTSVQQQFDTLNAKAKKTAADNRKLTALQKTITDTTARLEKNREKVRIMNANLIIIYAASNYDWALKYMESRVCGGDRTDGGDGNGGGGNNNGGRRPIGVQPLLNEFISKPSVDCMQAMKDVANSRGEEVVPDSVDCDLYECREHPQCVGTEIGYDCEDQMSRYKTALEALVEYERRLQELREQLELTPDHDYYIHEVAIQRNVNAEHREWLREQRDTLFVNGCVGVPPDGN